MLGDSHKAQEVFHTTLREAALGAAQGQLPKEPFWLFREARWRCLGATKTDLKPESLEIDEHEIAPAAPLQSEQLDPAQLALWISTAPDSQSTALSLFYLDEFAYREILHIAVLKLSDLPRCLSTRRRP